MSKRRILVLGGTTEARSLVEALAGRPELEVVISLAGRTSSPLQQAVPLRTGGFGGAAGLAAFLHQEAFDLLVDATHPFAARISRNAAEAAEQAGLPLIALRRPPWERQRGDRWTEVEDAAAAVSALGELPRRVFLAIGRQEAGRFAAATHHSYLVRSVEPVSPPLPLPDVEYLLARGPFAEAEERRLLAARGIEVVVAKNSGGEATYGKIAAARSLGIEVVMVQRPTLPPVTTAHDVATALALIDQEPGVSRERGV